MNNMVYSSTSFVCPCIISFFRLPLTLVFSTLVLGAVFDRNGPDSVFAATGTISCLLAHAPSGTP